jgi:glycosyltransferase involved in cell wall biosynthesis
MSLADEGDRESERRADRAIRPPGVSVVIPTYNRGYCIARAIKSVLEQSYADFELIVVDDGSTDDTDDVLRSVADPRLRVLRHPTNRGVGATINTGIRHAAGALIAIQDSDDEWLPEKLARQVAVMKAGGDKLGVVYCDQWRFRAGEKSYFAAPHITPADGIVYDRALDDALYNIGNQSLLIRRSCFDKVGLYDESLSKNEDLDMLIRISRHFHFQHIPEPLLNYYVTADSVTARGESAGIRTQETLFNKYLPDLARNPALLAKRAFWIGSFHMRTGDAAKGRASIRKALIACPFNPRYIAAALISLFGCSAYRAMHRLT